MSIHNLSLVASVTTNGKIGKDNKLLVSIPADLKFFKSITMHTTLIMGYNTFLSLPRILPGRPHIVLTTKHIDIEGVTVFNNSDELLCHILATPEIKYTCIGGGAVYNLFLKHADILYITLIDKDIDGDVDFPVFSLDDYAQSVISSDTYTENNGNEIEYSISRYKRIYSDA
jgi:dihydrofolate reductase